MSEANARATLEALGAVVGEAGQVLDAPCQVGGIPLLGRVEPGDGEDLARCLEEFSRHREPALIMGAGTRMALGNPARGVSIALSSKRLSGIVEFDAADGVVQVSAGTPLAELSRRVEAEGWLLPLDPPDRGGTLGGVLATALSGPRQRGFGAVRDAVLGLDTVLVSGERTRCGARVVKNVTGYDLAKLYVGSLGTIAVIEKAWLRLKPIPATTRVMEVELEETGQAFELALAASRRSTARAVGLTRESTAGGWRLCAEFAGEEPAVRADVDWLGTGHSGADADPGSIDALRARQGERDPDGLHARIHALPSRLAGIAAALGGHGESLLAYPEPGIIHASFAPGGETDWLDGVLAVLEKVRSKAGTEVVIEAMPEAARSSSDAFPGVKGLDLMRAIKLRFDPDGLLNPGRFVGGI